MRNARFDDARVIADIYTHYILNTAVTFEEDAVDAATIAERCRAVQDLGLPWLVSTRGQDIVGYAYATPWRSRIGYRFSAEVTVYVAPNCGGKGVGSALYTALFDRLRSAGLRTVIGGIALPNDASVALHEKFGMHKVAHFERVGIKFGRWMDVGYWQTSLSTADTAK
ncbi:MAG: N-acetyltransferase family protein [Myxococcota bacterium]